MDIGIPGWEVTTEFDRSLDGSMSFGLVLTRTSLGPWTEADSWVAEHGKAYLDEMASAMIERTLGPVETLHERLEKRMKELG